jgi:hypothetical protein
MGIISKVRLTVTEAPHDATYNDIVWVHWHHRGKPSAKVGTLVNVAFMRDGKRVSRVLSFRGVNDDRENEIRIDHVNRNEMGLKIDDTYEFTLSTTNWWQKLKWACSATDPGIRIASWIAVWFGVLGLIGVVLAAIGLYPVIKEIRADWQSHSATSTHSQPTIVSSPQHPAAPKDIPAAGRSGTDKQ